MSSRVLSPCAEAFDCAGGDSYGRFRGRDPGFAGGVRVVCFAGRRACADPARDCDGRPRTIFVFRRRGISRAWFHLPLHDRARCCHDVLPGEPPPDLSAIARHSVRRSLWNRRVLLHAVRRAAPFGVSRPACESVLDDRNRRAHTHFLCGLANCVRHSSPDAGR